MPPQSLLKDLLEWPIEMAKSLVLMFIRKKPTDDKNLFLVYQGGNQYRETKFNDLYIIKSKKFIQNYNLKPGDIITATISCPGRQKPIAKAKLYNLTQDLLWFKPLKIYQASVAKTK